MVSPKGVLVSLEGISGCGKTHVLRGLKERLGDTRAVFVSEVSDRTVEGLDAQIIQALKHTGDQFFRTGLPRTETFLLLALKIFDYEAIIKTALSEGAIVIEDRSIDTIAVYQSIMICDEHMNRVQAANAIYEIAARWRQPPNITFLIVDKYETAIHRAQERSGRAYSGDELELLRNAADLYIEYAKYHQGRIVCTDRQIMSDADIIEMIVTKIRESIV